MLKELALLVTLLALVADARRQRYEVQLNDPVVMSEEVDIKESLRADDGELLGNRDDKMMISDLRPKSSGSVTLQPVSIRNVALYLNMSTFALLPWMLLEQYRIPKQRSGVLGKL
eukprot:Em0010g994a